MAIFFTPGQFSARAHFYYSLAQLLAAGITLPAALTQLERSPPARSYRQPLRQISADLQSGFTFADALQRVDWLPQFDCALLRAGEESGRLDESFRLLAGYYTERARMARQVIGELAYPIALFHFAIFIFPFAAFFISGNWKVYLVQTVGVLAPFYFLAAILIIASQGRHGEPWRAFIERLSNLVPVLGKARRELALSRLSAALGGLLRAGVSILEAWELAGAASGSPRLRKTIVGWRPLVDGGNTPAEVVRASGVFPDLFVGQYEAAEISGSLEETLERLQHYYQDEGHRRMHSLAQWTPRVLYLGIVLMIAYRVVSFWTGYFRQIQNIGGF